MNRYALPPLMKRGRHVAAAILVAAALPAAAQVVPGDRLFLEAWRNAGCPDDAVVQNRMVDVRAFGAVGDGIANDQPAVLAAIAALAGLPGVVYIPPGTYLIQAPIALPGGTVLRGAGPQKTTLLFDFVDHAIRIYGSETGAWIALTEAADRHVGKIQVADPGAFSPGDYALLRQADDPAWNITDAWAAHSAGQVVRIASMDGTEVTLDRPLRHAYPLERNPELRRILANRHSGVENLRLERLLAGDNTSRNNRHTIQFSYAAEGWVRGVHSVMAFGSHVALYNSTRISVTGCFFDDAHEHDGGGSGYGVRVQSRSGECLIEDNILRLLRHAILLQAGSNGNVFGYNYSRDAKSDSHPTWAGDVSLHGNYPYANLFEGNIVEHLWIDNSHNGINGPFNTFFRNRAENCGFNMTDPAADSQNVVGNELFRGDFWARLFAGNGYRFQGSDHYTYGNLTEASGLQPPGTDDLADISYYLNDDPALPPAMPSWWTIADTLPVIGPPHARAPDKHIPARARFLAGGGLTVPAPVPDLAAPESLAIPVAELTGTLSLTNTGAGRMVWTLGDIAYEDGADWIVDVSPAAGVLEAGAETVEIIVAIDRAGLEPGSYRASVEITSNGGHAVIPIIAEGVRHSITTHAGPGGMIEPANPLVDEGSDPCYNP